MALTTTQQRVTRSKRVDENTTRREASGSSTTVKTAASKTIKSISTKTVSTFTSIKASSSNTTAARTLRSAGPADIDNEKENIDPLTGLDPLQLAALKKGKKKVFGSAGGNAPAVFVAASKSAPKQGPASTSTAKSTAPKPRKSRVSTSGAGEDTVAGRLIALRRHEAPSDRLARDLTVLPLVDLSEAFGIAQRPIIISETHAEEEKEPSAHALVAAELAAALQVLAQTTDEHRRLPTVLQRTRGIKRSIHSPATSAVKGSTSSETRRLSDPLPTNARPIKRMRRSVPGTATPKLTSTIEDDTPRAPPNTPVRSVRALPTEVAIEVVEAEVEASHAAISAPIPIPAKETQDADKTQEDSSFDNTQGSSHFSSVMGSFRLGLGLGLGAFNVSSTSVDAHADEEEVEEGGWMRWL